jgi:hypothetical protein
MAQDNRLVQEFQENGLTFDLGTESPGNPGSTVSLSGLYGGIMPYRQAPLGGLSDNLVEVSGLNTPGEPDRVNKHPLNRVCVFENEIHNIAQGQWHKQRADTGAWELVCNIDDIDTLFYNQIGLYPVFDEIANKRYLVTAYADDTFLGRNWKGLRYDPDTGIVETGVQYTSTVNSNLALTPSECQMGNNIYFAGHNEASGPLVLNGLSLDIARTDFPLPGGNIHRPVDLCSYSGQVYMAYKNITEIVGSGIVSIARLVPNPVTIFHLPFEDQEFAPTEITTDEPRGKCVLFVDNNPETKTSPPSMWLYYQTSPTIVPSGGGSVRSEGWSVWQMQGDGIGGLSVIRQNDTMMGNMRAGLGEDQIPINNNEKAVISYCDNFPGWFTSTPEKGFLTLRPFGGEPGQSHHQWDFEPGAGTGPPGGGGAEAGGPAKVSFSQDKLGGGSRWSPAAVSTTTGFDVNIFDIAYTSGTFASESTWRIYYKLMPSTAYHAGTTVNVRWYYDKFHAPNKRCSLIGTSHGTLGTNQADSIVMESGTQYYVDWDFGSDGFNKRDRLYLAGLAYISGADIGDL